MWLTIKTERPRRSYLQTALASAYLLAFLIHVSWHGKLALALFFWAGVSLIAAFVVRSIERSESHQPGQSKDCGRSD